MPISHLPLGHFSQLKYPILVSTTPPRELERQAREAVLYFNFHRGKNGVMLIPTHFLLTYFYTLLNHGLSYNLQGRRRQGKSGFVMSLFNHVPAFCRTTRRGPASAVLAVSCRTRSLPTHPSGPPTLNEIHPRTRGEAR